MLGKNVLHVLQSTGVTHHTFYHNNIGLLAARGSIGGHEPKEMSAHLSVSVISYPLNRLINLKMLKWWNDSSNLSARLQHKSPLGPHNSRTFANLAEGNRSQNLRYLTILWLRCFRHVPGPRCNEISRCWSKSTYVEPPSKWTSITSS
jgi:hypothetical protein